MLRSTIPLLAALLLLGACSSDAPEDATSAGAEASAGESDPTGDDGASISAAADELGVSVNGDALTVAEFDEHLESWARMAEAQGQTVRDDDEVLLPEFVGSITDQYLRFESFMDGLEADDVEITDDDRVTASDMAASSLGEPNDESARALAVEWLSGIAALEPTEADIDDYIDDNADDLAAEAICSSHILVATAEEADAVLDRLANGEVFADLAMELSTDPGSGAAGGDLGCVGPGAFVAEFEAAALGAEPGEVTDPVETEFGFHMILTRAPEAADLRPVAMARLQEATDNRLEASLETATVELAPQFGTWDADAASYLPPSS